MNREFSSMIPRHNVKVGIGWERGAAAKKSTDVSQSKFKSMLIYFFDINGIVQHESVPPGQTVNTLFYLEVLQRLSARIFRIRPDLAKNGWILHHDNAPAHSSLACP
ncbi:hypothetical protein PGB90_006513 [Kerria lacca]